MDDTVVCSDAGDSQDNQASSTYPEQALRMEPCVPTANGEEVMFAQKMSTEESSMKVVEHQSCPSSTDHEENQNLVEPVQCNNSEDFNGAVCLAMLPVEAGDLVRTSEAFHKPAQSAEGACVQEKSSVMFKPPNEILLDCEMNHNDDKEALQANDFDIPPDDRCGESDMASGCFEVGYSCPLEAEAENSVDMEHKEEGSGPTQAENKTAHPYIDGLKLDQLNDDVIFHVASLTDASSIRHGLSQSCQRFNAMFENDAYWKMRINLRWPKTYPAVSPCEDFSWPDACVDREGAASIWGDSETNMQHFLYSHSVYETVDAVHLANNGQILVSGDRNRNLNLVDLTKYKGPDTDEGIWKEMLLHTEGLKHKGWIWSIASHKQTLLTGCWDTYIRAFDMDQGLQLTSEYKCNSAVLSLYMEENEIVASCFDKKVFFIDRRDKSFKSRIFHKQAVLCVAGNEDYIISGSEDKSISIFDRRAGKMHTMLKLDTYPVSMCYVDNQLWFGDRGGLLHLHDGTKGGFQHVGTYDVGHTDKITGLIYTRGAMFTCSGDKTIKVLEPSVDPGVITSLEVHEKQIASIDYNSGVLVSAGGDDCIGVWLPRDWQENFSRI